MKTERDAIKVLSLGEAEHGAFETQFLLSSPSSQGYSTTSLHREVGYNQGGEYFRRHRVLTHSGTSKLYTSPRRFGHEMCTGRVGMPN